MKQSFVRGFFAIAFASAAALACSSGDEPDAATGKTRQALTADQARILGCERVSATPASSDWKTSAGSLSQNTAQHTQGVGSLAVANIGYALIETIPMTALTPMGSVATFDIFVPGSGSIPWGGVQLFYDRPSQGEWNHALPYQSLQNRAAGTFLRVETPLDNTTIQKLQAGADPVSRTPDGASRLRESGTWQSNEKSIPRNSSETRYG